MEFWVEIDKKREAFEVLKNTFSCFLSMIAFSFLSITWNAFKGSEKKKKNCFKLLLFKNSFPSAPLSFALCWERSDAVVIVTEREKLRETEKHLYWRDKVSMSIEQQVWKWAFHGSKDRKIPNIYWNKIRQF